MMLFEIFAGLWLFAFGAVIGSFLNVVVWRTPRGESIVGPSRCPKCGTAIRWYNNVPVFGWLWLGGKCRDCKLPISPRYPIVEFICGAMFLAVALAELRQPTFVDVMLDTDWVRVRVYAVHMLLLCALLAWALMDVDEQAIPGNQVLCLWLLGITIWLLTPRLDPTPATVGTMQLELRRMQANLLDAARGFFAGGALGAPIALATWWLGHPKRSLAVAVGCASVGLYLGNLATLEIAMVAVSVRVLSLIPGLLFRPLLSVPFTMDLYVAVIAYLCCHDTILWGDIANRLWLR